MVYDVTELKEYFGQRFNELKNSSNVINNALENFKSEIKLDLRNLQDKIDKKNESIGIRQETPSAANNSSSTIKKRSPTTL